MEIFRIRAVPQDDNCVLVLSGEADVAVAPDLLELGTLGLDEPSTRRLTIDLEALTFIDSTAIGALVHLHNQADDAGKQLWLRNVPPRVKRVVSMAGLLGLFSIEGDQFDPEIGESPFRASATA